MIKSSISLAYVGSLVPDAPPYINKAFSRAGNMCQDLLIKGFLKAGLSPSLLLSLRPVPSFPGSQQLIYPPVSKTMIEENILLDFLPFINITPLKQLSVGFSALFYLLRWGRRKQNIARKKVIYTYNISVPPGIFTLLGAKLTGSKAIVMVYDIGVPGVTVPNSFFYRIDYWLHKKTLPLFDGLVVITDAIVNDFAPKVPHLRIEGGISNDLITQYQKTTATSRRNQDCFTIATAGRLDDLNGINEILEAFASINNTSFRLHIAGIGPLEGLVRDAAEKDSRIIFHGFLPFEQIIKLYVTSDLLINMRLTQRINTCYFFPSKIMEYLASGVPVVTTCPGNMAVEYGEFAYLLHNETAEALAYMLLAVASLPKEKRRERGKAAQLHMAKYKTWDVQAEKIVHFLDCIANNNQEHI